MKIEDIIETTIHFVTTDADEWNEYTRYSADSWTVRMGESDEPEYDCKELEAMFQSALANERQKEHETSDNNETKALHIADVRHSNCSVLLTRNEVVKVYFKQKEKFGMTLTDSKKDAMKFKTKDEAIEYNYKFFFGEFEYEYYCG